MMLAIAVELLAGRYTAMQFNDRTKAEWPPHPARLFSAMVATWADSEAPSEAERSALTWLEAQAPPSITCSEIRHREVVTHFVPVNDPTALVRDLSRNYALIADARHAVRDAEQSGDERAIGRARKGLDKAEVKAVNDAARAGAPTGRESDQVAGAVLAVLPDNRGKQGRTYPTVVPDGSTVWFVWSGAKPSEEHRRVLDGLLARVARIGHSSTLVACRSTSQAPPPVWLPTHDAAPSRLRVPRAGLVDRLEISFASHRGTEPRTLPAGMAGYRRAGEPQPNPPTPLLGGDWYVLGIAGQRPPSAARTLAIARATRNALLVHSNQPPAEFLSGHQRSTDGGTRPTAPLDRPHLAIVPLPSVGHRHSDGAVFGIALVLPVDCSGDDREALERAMRAWSDDGFELLIPGRAGGSPIRLLLEQPRLDRAAGREPRWPDASLPARRRTATRGYWCRPALRWRTATPVALDRFPGNLHSKNPRQRARAEGEATASLARACVLAGLPEPTDITLRLDSPLAGVPAPPSASRHSRVRRFASYQTGSGMPRVCVHAELTFGESVYGPVLVGAGRYFGYGLCLPDDAEWSV